ncbi:886ee3df-8099-4b27-99d2-2dd608efd69a [Thermothielavioides terrestris]|uniref:886ee3df-8099-4b27-99d2-2dd608efd69a n=1 Tax=Thermothielavioides terrestris TaxID=2587410 RepID=A0A446BKF8_9PEZI|nr:886ee3df-8099-4b27-99d2-2dd608efd69a [Thermothielavioides terrestris]
MCKIVLRPVKLCRLAVAGDRGCPCLDAETGRVRPYNAASWVLDAVECCGTHSGPCRTCPAVDEPGNFLAEIDVSGLCRRF